MKEIKKIGRSTGALAAFAAIVLLPSCFGGPGFFEQDGKPQTGFALTEAAPVKSDSDGIKIASFSGDATTTQTVTTSDAADSSATASFPPGSLGIDLDITLGDSEALATDETTTELGLESGSISSASDAVYIDNSAGVDPAGAFEISIDLSGTALTQTDATRYAVLYRIVRYGEGGQSYVGIIPNKLLTIVDGLVTFSALYFGSYEVITLAPEVVVEEEVAAVSQKKPAIQPKTGPEPTPTPTPDPDPVDTGDDDDDDIVAELELEGPVKLAFGGCEAYRVDLLDETGAKIDFPEAITITVKATGPIFSDNDCVDEISDGQVTSTAGIGSVTFFYFGDQPGINEMKAHSDDYGESEIQLEVDAAPPPPAPTFGYPLNNGATHIVGKEVEILLQPIMTGAASVASWSVTGLPMGLSFDGASGVITGEIDPSYNPGPYSFMVTAVSVDGVSETETISIDVRDALWVQVQGDFGDRLNYSDDLPCTELFAEDCYDAGDHIWVETPDEGSCGDISMSDNLGVYDWYCDDTSSPTVFWGKFKDGKGVIDLINTAIPFWEGFEVELYKSGNAIQASILSNGIWSKTVARLTPSGLRSAITGNNNVFIVDSSSPGSGFTFGSGTAGAVLLVAPGITSTLDGGYATNDCGVNTCMIRADERIRIEGSFNAGNADYGLYIEPGADDSYIRNATFTASSGVGIKVAAADKILLDFVHVEGAGGNGVELVTSGGSKIIGGHFNSNGNHGLYVNACQNIQIEHSHFDNNGAMGLLISNAPAAADYHLEAIRIAYNGATNAGLFVSGSGAGVYFTLHDAVLAFNNGDGLRVENDVSSVVTDLKSFGNQNAGTYINGDGDHLMLRNMLVANGLDGTVATSTGEVTMGYSMAVANGGSGYYTNEGTLKLFSSYSINNNDAGIRLNSNNAPLEVNDILLWENGNAELKLDSFTDGGSGSNMIAGEFKVAAEVASSVGGPCGTMLSDNVFENVASNCLIKSGLLEPVGSGQQMFEGSTADDENDSDDATGYYNNAGNDANPYNFENDFRFWTPTAQPNAPGARGTCRGVGCQINDLSPAADSEFINVTGPMSPTDGDNCPNDVDPNNTDSLMYSSVTAANFLVNAYEDPYSNDPENNGNGLCEIDETCIYARHWGPYQEYFDHDLPIITCAMPSGAWQDTVIQTN